MIQNVMKVQPYLPTPVFNALISNAPTLYKCYKIYKKIPKAKIALIAILAFGTLVVIADEIECRKKSDDRDEEERRTWKKIITVLNAYRWFHSPNIF